VITEYEGKKMENVLGSSQGVQYKENTECNVICNPLYLCNNRSQRFNTTNIKEPVLNN
jgi:hypothetical protein